MNHLTISSFPLSGRLLAVALTFSISAFAAGYGEKGKNWWTGQ